MSFIEVGILLAEKRKKEQESWEKLRWNWYYSVIAQRGNKDFKNPQNLIRFPWEIKPKKEVKELTKEELQKKIKEAEKYLNNGKR